MLDDLQHVSADHLNEYLRGELDPAEEAAVEEHISSCLVCARRLREEAQLEVLLHEAHDEWIQHAAPVVAAAPSRRALWQRVAATVANTAAAAAALVLVITPGQQLGGSAGPQTLASGGMTVSTSAFVNDALCFPSTTPTPDEEACDEPMMVAMVTDPDDYLSPFDGQSLAEPFGDSSSEVGRACLVEDLACEPS